MLRIYLDSNVYRYIKPKHPSYNKDLHSLMDALVGELLFIYSGAHLDDLKTSVDPYSMENLELMKKPTFAETATAGDAANPRTIHRTNVGPRPTKPNAHWAMK